MNNHGGGTAVSTFRFWAGTLADCSPEFLQRVERKLVAVEELIDYLLDQEEAFIRDAGRYVLKSGGKRLRPLLLIVSAQLGSYPGDDDVYIGTAVEYIHTATLVHDDIIDNAYERRGQKAVNQVYGNHTAVLLGDYFYTKAMDMALEYGDLKILRIISHITTQMLKGEVLGQIHDGNLWMSEPQILDIIVRKTACLFSGCCQIGAILARLPGDLEARMAEFGMQLGIAFQIVDDLLDYTGTEKELGKPALHDLMEGKITLPFYYLMQRAAPEEMRPILDAVERKDYHAVDTGRLQELVQKYDIVETVYQEAQVYAERARELLYAFPINDAHRLLDGLMQFILDRRW